ncbi:fibrinogen-like protein 1 isoform X2 [Grus americana]|uniref:fibrinogen-like protein 1 isoform X2 n=1 Tax=Grus americana TaxID=9117 RepID=UPI0024084E94|nr:fibrinogen-like protein 1 isoform X2 [Grus americana]XP_054698545.1 fibrinogen-like protein 1 isoform X2 [Grus americana]
MSVMMPWLLLLLLLVSFGSPAPRFSEKDICLLDNNKLRQRLKLLQDLLYLYELQLKDILENNYHRTKSGLFSGNRSMQHEMLLPTTSGNLIVYDQDCSTLFNRKKTENGYYRIRPRADREPFLAYCDMSDGGGWTVIQRRSNGKENFNRKWDDYRSGFGKFQGRNDEYWLGNDHIYDLLARGENSLKIDLMDWHGERRYAVYENFRLANEQLCKIYLPWFLGFLVWLTDKQPWEQGRKPETSSSQPPSVQVTRTITGYGLAPILVTLAMLCLVAAILKISGQPLTEGCSSPHLTRIMIDSWQATVH